MHQLGHQSRATRRDDACDRALVSFPDRDGAMAALHAAQEAFDAAPVVGLEAMFQRNLALVRAIDAGVPVKVVERCTRLHTAALELALARGQYRASTRSFAEASEPA
ncbi:hypothetical protein [Georgenia sp. AZ-5]|uniref:hypothetical protein n=1 Tax=Georgenia sp. AZ-5 TaxID=3367526 RepID=UPI00375504B7